MILSKHGMIVQKQIDFRKKMARSTIQVVDIMGLIIFN